ncbi:magnesium transporter [Clostridiaceae bacterium AM27-36LB]|nr:magnesium transporter [Clostridiales bacterium AM23-16LB]RHR44094.1 magnesium transporter [Clostridiaceae bacterium AF18-31LB]RHT82012.1 magnesium transporter [Clostridiaceae bacterium AM27-36LB]RHW00882.1 magnesium transporter [Clostridiaceae bacterium OF09-1]
MDKMVQKPNYVEELLEILRGSLAADELQDQISDYHESDIADAFEQLTEEERKRLYPLLGSEWIAEIFTYIEDPDEYLKELDLGQAAQVLSYMDSDDAVDVLDELDDTTQEKLVGMMDEESSHDIKMLQSYEDDEVGSLMTTNFIVIHENLTIRQAMRELIRQAGENDNISTVYVIDKNDQFYGAIDLKDLIIAREKDALEDIISTSYPYVTDHEKIDDCIEQIKDYAEDSIPVLTEDKQLIGVITAQDLVEVVDDAMGEDYAKLAGLTAEEDLEETTTESMKKRLPWLVILLFLGLAVSTVVGVFETVVAVLPIVMCFQSLILDMAGNVGTQSLAVTIRVLMDENLTAGEKVGLVFKEMKVGFFNGLFLGIMAFIFIGLYIWLLKGNPVVHAFVISGCVGFSLMAAMVISSLVGTLIPMFFHKIKIDPAVASGPLITTVNDLVAVVIYYGLVWILLIHFLHMV